MWVCLNPLTSLEEGAAEVSFFPNNFLLSAFARKSSDFARILPVYWQKLTEVNFYQFYIFFSLFRINMLMRTESPWQVGYSGGKLLGDRLKKAK